MEAQWCQKGATTMTQAAQGDRRHRQRLERAQKRAERQRITRLRERIEWDTRREAQREAMYATSEG
jgi:hypothetical protein